MKRFTNLCAAVLAAMFALPALADGVDVTSKMTNPDGSQKLFGWTIDYDRKGGLGTGQNWSPSNHNGENEYGYWGWTAPNFEMWNGSQTVVDANTLSQTVKNLPNGTYVFSAFCVAVRSWSNGSEDPEDYKQTYGGYLFANGDSVDVATNSVVSDVSQGPWMHGRRFSVATTVTNGELKVGMGAKAETNIFWLGFDGVQLYSFGDMTPEKALFAMADIQLNQDKAIADSLMEYPMTAEGALGLASAYVTYLNAKTYEDVQAAEDSLLIACAWARKGIKSMSSLVDLVAEAKEVAEGEWSDNVAQQVVDLKKAIANAEAVLKENSLYESGVSEYKKELQEAVNQVRIDELWNAYDALNIFLDDPDAISEDNPCFGVTSHPGFGNEEGQYLANQEDLLRALVEQVSAVLEAVQSYEMTATDALEYVSTIEQAVATCVATANSAVKSLPYKWVTIPNPDDPTRCYKSTYGDWDDDPFFNQYLYPVMLCGCEAEVYRVTSPVFRLPYSVKQISFQILESAWGGSHLLDELYIFDADGYRIKLPDSQISCNFNSWSSWQGKTYQAFFDDSDIEDYWNSGWEVGPDGHQTITFTFDEPLDEFYFVIENRHANDRIAQLPLEINILGSSDAEANLKAALDEVKALGNFYVGTNPGFYSSIPTDYLDAVATAQSLLSNGGTDAEMAAATEALYACMSVTESLEANPIEEGVEYMLSCAYVGFHLQSGHRVAMSLFQDSILWWEPADPSNPNQKWTFELLDGPDEEGYMYYNVKNVGTGKYLTTFLGGGTAFEPTGEEITWGNPEYVKTSDTPGRWRLFMWGDGSWGFRSEVFPGNWATCHCINHNNGVPTNRVADQGCGRSAVHPEGFGIAGVSSAMGNWEAGGASSWYFFPDLNALPVADAVAGQTYHFSTGSQIFSLTANGQKFDDLHFYDLNGNEMPYEMKATANSVVVKFNEVVVDFSFTFAGSDGVKVTIDAASFETTKYELLQQAYNEVKKDSYVEGTDVGCVKSLTDYNAAIAKAEALLENGGTDEELVAATDALYAAADGLEVIYPDEEKTYIIVNANPWMENIGQDLAMFNFLPTQTLGYSYLDEQDPAFQWKFKAAPEKGEHHYYMINMADQTNIGYAWALETHIPMTTDSCTYEIGTTDLYNAVYFHADNSDSQFYSLHCSSRGNTNAILLWEAAATGTRWYVREVVNEDTHVYDLEDLVGPATSEPQAIYDLFGRRVVNPEKGVFIIEGKKKYVK